MAEESVSAGFDTGSPANIAPVVVWLGSPRSAAITGRVFTVTGGTIAVAETWVKGPSATKTGRWDFEELGHVMPDLVSRARANSSMEGQPRT